MRRIIGIDLSGPAGAQRTSVAVFRSKGEYLELEALVAGADDAEILRWVPDSAVVGLDAPLSYSSAGGSRASDVSLREALRGGLHPGSVMAPSAPRMVYLTLRGVAVSRLIETERPGVDLVEVHPTAALVLRGAPVDSVRAIKRDAGARQAVLDWLETVGLRGMGELPDQSDHSVAACAAALAAWKWHRGEAVWVYKAEPPLHPYDFAC
ncbi:putative nuclease with RNAse H fold [Alkalispirillum mobile]|uniref:Putative nuclease with RNAse H fold n=1 Tax=Alkalispirillum mobile TaxID=85925 RepID=A0A498C5Q3_9GAMM|nr:DUF429 domain-containing protein [Alkalispirillum mobile]RLK50633.1 putative nuclease with RNAse H fold [Alkalispirillum mobile]